MTTALPAGLLVIWHSRTGAARALARAAHAGARAQAGADAVRLVAATRVRPADLLGAAGYLFVCPENLGTMTGEMKAMFDRCYYPCLDRLAGRPFATIVAAGNAGQGTVAQIARIAAGWRLRAVAEPVIANLGIDRPEAILAPKRVDQVTRATCRDLGRMLAAGLALGIF